MTFLLIFNMLSRTHTDTRTHMDIYVQCHGSFHISFLPKDKLIFSTLPQMNVSVFVCLCLCMCAPVPQNIQLNFRLKMEIVQKLHNVLFTRSHTYTQKERERGGGEWKTDVFVFYIWVWIILAHSKLFLYQNLCSVPKRFFFSTQSEKKSEPKLSDISFRFTDEKKILENS